jgi:hypothetical protein
MTGERLIAIPTILVGLLCVLKSESLAEQVAGKGEGGWFRYARIMAILVGLGIIVAGVAVLAGADLRGPG